jgi:hypothetical protein
MEICQEPEVMNSDPALDHVVLKPKAPHRLKKRYRPARLDLHESVTIG